MSDFARSHLGRLRALVGSRLLLAPGVRVVVEDERGAVLLQHRADFGLWGLPGGVPDEGESADDAIRRETLEETGYGIRDLAPFGFASDPAHETWTYPNGDRCHYFTLLYAARAEAARSDVFFDDETLAIGWFAPDALPALLPPMARTLAAYRDWRAGGRFQSL